MAPRFRVGVEAISFALICGTATLAALAYSKAFGPSDEEKERIVRERYPERVQKMENQMAQMQAHFDKLKRGSNADMDAKLDGLLHAGKNEKKRHYPYEPSTATQNAPPSQTVIVSPPTKAVSSTENTSSVPGAPSSAPAPSSIEGRTWEDWWKSWW